MRKSLDGIEYNYIDPTGNITVLVSSKVDINLQPEIADMIMKIEPTCEQVGFVDNSDKADIRLRMAAGEFCGNATMSTAALFCEGHTTGVGKSETVSVESSGCDHVIEVNITRLPDIDNRHAYTGAVDMPPVKEIKNHSFEYMGRRFDCPLVMFEGISHIIFNEDSNMLSEKEAEEAIRKWCDDISCDALGIMHISSETVSDPIGGNSDINIEINLRPLVYVRKIESLFWENSCASGTTAVGAYYAKQSPGHSALLTAHEPGGVLSVHSRNDGHLILSGTVLI